MDVAQRPAPIATLLARTPVSRRLRNACTDGSPRRSRAGLAVSASSLTVEVCFVGSKIIVGRARCRSLSPRGHAAGRRSQQRRHMQIERGPRESQVARLTLIISGARVEANYK